MSKQFYFSFVLAALSFITVKRIQKAGVEQYHYFQTVFQKEDGWFNFKEPSLILNLPFELREISGLTNFSDIEIACFQDENGILFVYDLLKDSIIGQFDFGFKADYQGLTKVDSSYFTLRSDATLLEIAFPFDSLHVTETKLNIQEQDNEGLCYDERNNRLLIAPKSKFGKGKILKDIRAIYAIDLATKELNETPVFTINISEMEAFANKNQMQLPQKISKQSPDSISALKFIPSALAVHPKTDEIYVLSAVDQTLAVFDKNGTLLNFVLLDTKLFNKPGGITFLSNGDLIIVNEGQMGVPTLLKFDWLTLEVE
jgi:hypothetical protein